MSVLINLLSNSGYIIVNKEIIKKLGLREAIILGELCSEYNYWEKTNRLENGYFFSTRENIENNTGLSAYQQREPFKKLLEMGIILEKLKGMPQQKWYSLDMDKLYELLNSTDLIPSSEETKGQGVKKLDTKLLKNLTPSSEESEHLDVKKLDTNNNNNNNNNSNNKDDIVKDKFRDTIFLSTEQYQMLLEKFGRERTERTITRLDLYKKSTGKKYNDDYSTLLLWIDEDIEREKKAKKENNNIEENNIWLKSLKEQFGDNFEGLYANLKTTNY